LQTSEKPDTSGKEKSCQHKQGCHFEDYPAQADSHIKYLIETNYGVAGWQEIKQPDGTFSDSK